MKLRRVARALAAAPCGTAEYFIRDNLGIEILASWPFSDIGTARINPLVYGVSCVWCS